MTLILTRDLEIQNRGKWSIITDTAIALWSRVQSCRVSLNSGLIQARGLTSHELRAIVNVMLLRVNHKPFGRCHIHPVCDFAHFTWLYLRYVQVLVLSFMGDYQGRIIQASYDGKGLILQYSQLWSFADIKKGTSGIAHPLPFRQASWRCSYIVPLDSLAIYAIYTGSGN
jgi:hypothetical protein